MRGLGSAVTEPQYMPINVAEFLAETDDLTGEEFSVYQLLICHMWIRGGVLPNDPERIARLARIDRAALDRVWLVVGKFFHDNGETLSHQRLAQDLERAREVRESAGLRARKGAYGKAAKTQPVLPGILLEAEPKQDPSRTEAELKQNPSRTEAEPAGGGAHTGAERDLLRKSGSGSGSPSLRSAPFSHSGLLSLFSAIWSGIYFEEYTPTPADRSQLGRLMAGFPDKAAIEAQPWQRAFTNYLADNDKFVNEQMRHSLQFFCTSGGLNKYRTKARTTGYSKREIDSATASQEWLNNDGGVAHGRAR